MGPFIIVRQTGLSIYLVKRQGEEASLKVHVSALKPYIALQTDDPDPSDNELDESSENSNESNNEVEESPLVASTPTIPPQPGQVP